MLTENEDWGVHFSDLIERVSERGDGRKRGFVIVLEGFASCVFLVLGGESVYLGAVVVF